MAQEKQLADPLISANVGETESLADALPREIERVRHIQDLYKELRWQPNVIVEPQIAMMEYQIADAIKACAEGDVVSMLHWYNQLKDWQE